MNQKEKNYDKPKIGKSGEKKHSLPLGKLEEKKLWEKIDPFKCPVTGKHCYDEDYSFDCRLLIKNI
jgi:hypothetical protein